MNKPTQEQTLILEAAKTARVLKIEALAGAGKSSTLVMLANQDKTPSIYLTFNKSLAEEAKEKFPQHVDCRTTHSMCYAKYGAVLRSKLAPTAVGNKGSEVATILSLKDAKNVYTKAQLGSWILDTVRSFESDGNDAVSKYNVPRYEIERFINRAIANCESDSLPYDSVDIDSLVQFIIAKVSELWLKRSNPSDKTAASFDTYVKLYALNGDTPKQSVMYSDETQDSSGAFIRIMKNHVKKGGKLIVVGDTYQQIYGFRGAVNALDKIKADKTLYLTKSFRFGQPVADIANKILQLGGDKAMKGFEVLQTKVGGEHIDNSKPITYLFRSNAALLSEAVEKIEAGVSVDINVDVTGFCKRLQAIQDIDNKGETYHPEFKLYKSLKALSDDYMNDPEIQRMVKTVKDGKAEGLISTLTNYRKPRSGSAMVVLTTSHKSKGAEYDQVVLANDFTAGLGERVMTDEERNLIYVAATRAKKVLVVNKLVKACLDGSVLRVGEE